MNKTKKVLTAILIIIISLAVIIGGYLAYVWFSYDRIEDYEYIETMTSGSYSYFENDEAINAGKAYNIMTYNIGFGAYTKDYSFFMDGGKSSWAVSEEGLIANVCEITDVINRSGADFILLQEVDRDGTRSYHVDELSLMNQFIKGYYYNYASNYHSAFMLYPIYQPHGANNSGLVTYSRAPIADGLRRSLPISDSFSKLFDLDRCYTISRIPTANEKMLCIFNVHLSAYSDDDIRNQQLDMLYEDMKNEYNKGNYVVCGGDFNMDLKGQYDGSEPGNWTTPIDIDHIPEGFSLGIDKASEEGKAHNTCRNADIPYDPEESFTVSTDGFIVSDNIRVNHYIHGDWGYEYSDHDPVLIQIFLKY